VRTDFRPGESPSNPATSSSPVAQWSDTHVIHAEDEVVLLPDSELLLTSMYSRAGVDLVISSPNGIKYVVKGYFLNDHLPTLSDGMDTHIPGELAKQFAGSIAPEQYAQATGGAPGPVIGVVRSVSGQVLVIRASDGAEVVLKVGDPLYQDDIIETAAGANVGLVFIDGTTLALGSNGELVLDELIYDPSKGEGKGTLRLISGAAEFVSGGIAKSGADAMVFQTPVATIGIRGTRVFASYDPVTGDVTVLNRPTGQDAAGNQTAGVITLTLPDGTVIGDATLGNAGWQWNPVIGTQPQTVQLTEQQVQNIAGAVLNTVNNLQTQIQQPNVIPTPGGDGTNVSPGGAPPAPGGDGGPGPGDDGAPPPPPPAPDGTQQPPTPPPQQTQTPVINTGNVASPPTGNTGTGTGTPGANTGNTGNAAGTPGTGTGTGTGFNTPPPVTPAPPPAPPLLIEPVLFSISGGAASDATQSTITFTVTRAGNLGVSASVNYATVGGTADAGTDFVATSGTVTFAPGETSATISVVVLANVSGEPEETFSVVLSDAGAAGGVPANITGGAAIGVITADPLSTFSIGDATAAEGATAVLTVTRGGDLSRTVSVDFSTQAGTALAGADFVAQAGTLTFAPGQATATISVPIVSDNVQEPAESFFVVLGNPIGGTIGQATGTVSIPADPPLPSISIVGGSISDLVAGTLNFTLTMSAARTVPVSVNFATVSGSATAGSDFGAVSGTVVFAPGQTTAVIGVPIFANAFDEAAETFSVILSGAVGATIGVGNATGTILADPPRPQISIAGPGEVSDAVAGAATFTVTLSQPTTMAVTVAYTTVAGSADSSDFVPQSGVLTFAPGQTSATISVPILANASNETAETFSVVLSSPTNGTISVGSATVTIIADPPSPPAIAEFSIDSVSVSDATNTNAVFTVTRSGDTSGTVSVQYTTQSGGATAGTDFTPVSGTLTFTPGQTTATISVPILADSLGEAAETFTVVLSDATGGAVIINAVGTGTIVADPAASGSAPVILGVASTNAYMQLDGIDDFFVSDAQLTLSSHTIEGWVRSGADNLRQLVVGVGDGAALYLENGKIRAELSFGGNEKVVESSVLVADGDWHHIGYSYDAATDTVVLYIDGVADPAPALIENDSISTFSVTDHIYLGADGNPPHFRGDFDDIRVWSAVRSASDIQTYSKSPVTGSTSGLQANYTFEDFADDLVGNKGDAGGSGLDAYASGSPSVIGGAGTALNLQGGAHAFAAGLTALPGSFTIQALIKLNAVGDIQPIASKNAQAGEYNSEFKVFINENGYLQLRMGDDDSSNGFNLIGTTELQPGTWYHVAAVYHHESGYTNLYVNGHYDNDNSFNPLERQTSDAHLVIGQTTVDGNAAYFNGRMKGLHIWDRPLSSNELQSGSESSGVNLEELGLVAAYLFGEGGGTTLFDSGGSGFNATITGGAPTWLVDAPPMIGPTTLAITEDTPLSFFIYAQDSDGDVLQYSVHVAPAHGSVNLDGNGGAFYLPDSNFNGADTFTIRVSDGNGNHVDQAITVNVTPVNDRPQLTGDGAFAVEQDDTNPSGTSIATLFAGKFVDVDAGDGFLGIVVVGDLSDTDTEGVYQYYDNYSASWEDISSVNDDLGDGMLLSVNALVRFVPVAGYSGTPGALVVRPLDNIYNDHGNYSPPYSDSNFVYGPIRVADVSGYTVLLGGKVLLEATVAASIPVVWDGGGSDGLWGTAANWDQDFVPLASSLVQIGGVAVVLLATQSAHAIGGLTLQDTASLTVGNDAHGTSTNLTVSGSVAISASSSLSFYGGGDNNGNFEIGGNLTTAGGFVLGGVNHSASLSVGGTLTNAETGLIALHDGGLALADALHNDGTMSFKGEFSLAGSEIFNDTATTGLGTILIDAATNDVDVTFAGYGTFENAGLIHLTGAGAHDAKMTFGGSAQVLNQPQGIIKVDGEAGATGARTIDAYSGLVNVGHGVDPGLIDIRMDTLLTGSVYNGGRIKVDNGVTLTYSNGWLTMSHSGFDGTLEGSGTIYFDDSLFGPSTEARFITPSNYVLQAADPTLHFGSFDGNNGVRWQASGTTTIDGVVDVTSVIMEGSTAQFVLNGALNVVGGTPGPNNIHAYASINGDGDVADQSFTISGSGVFTMAAGTIGDPGDFDDDATVYVDFYSNSTNNGIIALTSTGAWVGFEQSGGSFSNIDPDNPNYHRFNNNGVIDISGTGEAYIRASNFRNNATGDIDVAMETRFVGNLFNAGAINIERGTTLFIGDEHPQGQRSALYFKPGSDLTVAGASGMATLHIAGGDQSGYSATTTLFFERDYVLSPHLHIVLGARTVINNGNNDYDTVWSGYDTNFDNHHVTVQGQVTAYNSEIGLDVTLASGSTFLVDGSFRVSFANNTVVIEDGAELTVDAAGLTGGLSFAYSVVENYGDIVLTNSISGPGTGDIDFSVYVYDPGEGFFNKSTGTLTIEAGVGGGNRTISGVFANQGQIIVNTNAHFYIDTDSFENLSGGLFLIGAGVTVNFNGTAGPGLGSDFYNHAGAMLTVNGTLNMNGLNLYNDGTLSGHANINMGGGTYTLDNGVDDAGVSPGYLHLDGNAVYKQGSRTNVELGGTQSGEYDVRIITGRFTAGGTLAVLPWLSFAAAAGDSFDVFTWGTREGMFHEATGLTQFEGVALDTVFTDGGLTLAARAVTHTGDGDVLGTSGDDTIVGRGTGTLLDGGAGDDLIIGGDGGNVFVGGAGSDRLIGGLGIDTADYSADPGAVRVDLQAGTATDAFGGEDTLISIENLIGSDYDDVLIGNDKDNVIVGGLGADTLTGGAGADLFVLRKPEDGGDTITDFTPGEDRIVLEDFGLDFVVDGANFSVIAGPFDGTSAGNNAAFLAGEAALIFSVAENTLYHDLNGAADGYSVVAVVPGVLLSANDIQIYTSAA